MLRHRLSLRDIILLRICFRNLWLLLLCIILIFTSYRPVILLDYLRLLEIIILQFLPYPGILLQIWMIIIIDSTIDVLLVRTRELLSILVILRKSLVHTWWPLHFKFLLRVIVQGTYFNIIIQWIVFLIILFNWSWVIKSCLYTLDCRAPWLKLLTDRFGSLNCFDQFVNLSCHLLLVIQPMLTLLLNLIIIIHSRLVKALIRFLSLCAWVFI